MAKPSHSLIQTNRLSDADQKVLLDRLDATDALNPHKNRRRAPRIPYRKNNVTIRIHHPGGSTAASYVSTRNLSDGGISFLYHGFLYKGTHVEVVLTRLTGGEDVHAGVVQHCALVQRMYHLIGVQFTIKIAPELYLRDPSEQGKAVAADRNNQVPSAPLATT
jgi:hypothetical protein